MVATRRRPAPPRAAAPRGAREWAPLLLLALAVVLLSAYVLRYALDTNKFTSVDELLVVDGGRAFAADPLHWLLSTSDFFQRGPERLAQWAIALSTAAFGSTPGELRGAHVLLTTVYFAAAFPLYALARGIGLAKWPAAAVAALGVVGPWVLYSTTLLNVTVAVPANMALAWGAWYAATHPSLRNDALVILLAVVNTLARTGHAPFAAVAVLAALYAVWLSRPAGEPIAASLRRYPMRFVRAHPLLAGVSALGILVLAILGPARIVGTAYAPQGRFTLPPLSGIEFFLGHWTAQLAIATGFVPFIVGTAWLLRELVRPHDRATGTFAAVAVGMFAIWIYLTANHGTQIEERYVAVLGGLVPVAFGAAVFRRESPVLGTVLVAILAGRAVVTKGFSGLAPSGDPFAYFIAPGRLFYERIVIGRLNVTLPGGDAHVPTIAMVLAGAAALAVAAMTCRWGARRLAIVRRRPNAVAAAVVAPFAALALFSGWYVLDRYEPATQPERSLYGMAWIERAAGGEPATIWAHDVGIEAGGRRYLAQLASFFNANTCCGFWLADLPALVGADGKVPQRTFARGRHLVRFTGYHPLLFGSTTVAKSSYIGMYELRVERFEGPPAAAIRLEGPNPEGWLDPGVDAVGRILPAGRREAGRCLTIDASAPQDARAPARWRAAAGGRATRGTIPPGETRPISVRLDGRTPATIRHARGAQTAFLLGEGRVADCVR